MTKALLSLVLMLKNEVSCVKQLIGHAAPAVDRVDLLDTGSTDNTISLAYQCCRENDLEFRVLEKPFVDYATSRNDALSFAHDGESIFALLLSGDDYITGAESLRTFCESHRDQSGPGHNLFSLWCQYGETLLQKPSVIRLGTGWRWKGVTHEYLECNGDYVGCVIPAATAKIVRTESDPRRKSKQLYRDLELLHAQYQQDPEEPRTVFYLAQTLEGLGFWAEAARMYVRRSEIHSGWDEEQYVAKYRAGLCTLWSGLPAQFAERILWDAVSMRPTRAEAMIALGELFLTQERYVTAYRLAERAMLLPFPWSDGLSIEPSAYGDRLDKLISNTAAYAKAYSIGEHVTQRLVDRYPEDTGFQRNLERYRKMIADRHQNTATESLRIQNV